jgi:hypothetical protein
VRWRTLRACSIGEAPAMPRLAWVRYRTDLAAGASHALQLGKLPGGKKAQSMHGFTTRLIGHALAQAAQSGQSEHLARVVESLS